MPAKHRSRSRGRAVELVPSPASNDHGGPARLSPRPSTRRPRAASPAPHSSQPARKAATTAAEWGSAVRRREEGDKNGPGHTQLPEWDGAAPIDMAFDAVAATIVCIGVAAGESVLILSASILVSLLVLALKRSARGARVPEPEWILSVAPPRSFLPQEQHGKNDPPLPSPQHAQRMRPRTCFAAPHLLPLPRPQPHHAPLPRSPQTRQSWCATAPGHTWSRSRASPARSAPRSPRRSQRARRWGAISGQKQGLRANRALGFAMLVALLQARICSVERPAGWRRRLCVPPRAGDRALLRWCVPRNHRGHVPPPSNPRRRRQPPAITAGDNRRQ